MNNTALKERSVRCPTCGKTHPWQKGDPNRPFCSERCQLIDLGNWASEKYLIPGDDQETEDRAEHGIERKRG